FQFEAPVSQGRTNCAPDMRLSFGPIHTRAVQRLGAWRARERSSPSLDRKSGFNYLYNREGGFVGCVGLAASRRIGATVRPRTPASAPLSKPVGDKAVMSSPSTKTAPYGSWKSPITSDLIVAQSITLSELCLDGGHVYWLEGRPQEQGRYVVVRADADGQPTNITPPPDNARTRVHEYGGGSWTVRNGTVYFSNFADGRLY